MIIAKYLPWAMSKKADFQLRNVKNSNDYKLNLVVFQKTFHQCRTADLDHFCVSSVSTSSSLHIVEIKP